MHDPVDHKDDSAEYRQHVWNAVSLRVGAELTPLEDTAKFEGQWDVAFDMFGSQVPAYTYRFIGDSELEMTVLLEGSEDTTRETWRVPRNGSISLSGAAYHAATTTDGRLVMFNGDQSVVMVATPRIE
ncbi:MAG: hypothetical protein NXI04_03315 [Planctomycetaceae bacterium]|nr:hypothetical protein [Planctomycetaceae bacterium]